jgi:hypothetical protein
LCRSRMMTANDAVDCSCDTARLASDPDLGFARTGGFEGSDDGIDARILAHVAFAPSGRAIVVPDAIGINGRSVEECPPFACDSHSASERLAEIHCFDSSRNTVFVFESGESQLIDRDQRIHWARSRINSGQVRPI